MDGVDYREGREEFVNKLLWVRRRVNGTFTVLTEIILHSYLLLLTCLRSSLRTRLRG